MKKLFFTLITFFLILSTAYADAGLPMLIVIWPMYWLLLIPIILIESCVSKHYLHATPFHKILWPITKANLISTFFGIPITWVLLYLLEKTLILLTKDTHPPFFYKLPEFWQRIIGIPMQAPWILPYNLDSFWIIPLTAIFLLIPFYFASAWIESVYLSKNLKISSDPILIKKISWKANLASYIFLFLACLAILAWDQFPKFYP